MNYGGMIPDSLTLPGQGFQKLAQTGGGFRLPPLNYAPLYPN